MSQKHQLKYIVISDLHLGEEDSLFTQNKNGTNELLEAFSDCMADLLYHFNGSQELPKLILNGDILGLAFSTYPESLGAFHHFVKAMTVQNKICDKVIYIPGNHDHHIWQLTMEDDYQQKLLDRSAASKFPERTAATGSLYEDGLKSNLLESFMKKEEISPTELKVFYPNFLLPAPTNDTPFILFHHGHFAENTYHFISKSLQALYPELKSPEGTGNLELQNGAWINFAFSQLGRSGEAGTYFEKLMHTLSNKEELEKQKDQLANNIAKNVDFPYLPFHWMEKFLTKRLLSSISNRVRGERYKGGVTCSDETMQNLLAYFNKFCKSTLKENGWTDQPLQFVWGHTHKPFEKITASEIFGKLKITNTGGWVLPPQTSPKHGASIVLINQNNDVQALRVFMDFKTGDKTIFKVETAQGETMSEFGKSLEEKIYQENKLSPLWETFKNKLESEIALRRN